MDRRYFLNTLAAGAGLMVPLGRSAWAATAATSASGAPTQRKLIVVMLRGAVDGLNVVAPVADADYAALRPTIALAKPGAEGGALDLDGYFALHPALAPLMPLWQQKKLAFVHASGSPDASRSHFDAQDYMESATPGVKSTQDGWMNRLLAQLPGGLHAHARPQHRARDAAHPERAGGGHQSRQWSGGAEECGAGAAGAGFGLRPAVYGA
ncbi:DUF1501 domain-containing protein [Pseudoduganella sp. UC29_106]|uniref:DUF1501 domain-containing protein n=1 Tax=Pseudoduganella sp. UC29_106 TaxID=3374553 RepID=UPI0037563379